MISRVQEIALITRCVAADDRHAFGQLVEAYSDDIRRLLLSLTRGDVALVDDLAQETFLKAYLAIRSFKGIARFRTWIYRIAYNEYVSHCRSTHTSEPLETIGDDSSIASDADEDQPLVSDEAIHDAVLRLPEGERVVTQLFYFDDFSISRISKVTGMPQGTIKCYLNRARKKLAILLKDYEEQ